MRSVQHADVPGAGDDQLNPPSVTPAPAPADDQLLRLAAVGAGFGVVVGLLLLRWLRKNVVISRRG